jgi:hypothetical protein
MENMAIQDLGWIGWLNDRSLIVSSCGKIAND